MFYPVYHEISTYWAPVKPKSLEYVCYFIKVDGKEITNISYGLGAPSAKYDKQEKVSLATIILDIE
jgi:hypothetical protein